MTNKQKEFLAAWGYKREKIENGIFFAQPQNGHHLPSIWVRNDKSAGVDTKEYPSLDEAIAAVKKEHRI